MISGPTDPSDHPLPWQHWTGGPGLTAVLDANGAVVIGSKTERITHPITAARQLQYCAYVAAQANRLGRAAREAQGGE